MGRALPETLREMFFDPLQLADTSLGRLEDRRERESEIRLPAQSDSGGDGTDWHWNSDCWRNFAAPWGGMLTTAAELTALCQVFLNGGELTGVRVLSKASVAAMTRDQTEAMASLSAAEKLGKRWGLGWRLREDDLTSRRAFGHGGGHGNGCLGRPGDRGDACAADQRPGRRRAFAGAGLERGSGRGLIEEHLRLPIWRSVSVSQNSWFVVIRSPRVGWQSGWQRSGKSDPMKKHPTLKCRARTRSGCPCQKSPVAGKKTGVGFTVVGRRVPRRPKARRRQEVSHLPVPAAAHGQD